MRHWGDDEEDPMWMDKPIALKWWIGFFGLVGIFVLLAWLILP